MSDQIQTDAPTPPNNENHFQALLPQERYAIIIGRLEQEHALSNSRMMWLLTFQGFLFAAIAVSNKDGKPIFFSPDFFRYVVPIIGMVSALAVLFGIIASRLARRQLKADWKNCGIVGFPAPSPSSAGAKLGVIPGLVVPAILALAWLFLLFAPTPDAVAPLANSMPIISQSPASTIQATPMPTQVSGTNSLAP